MFKLLLGAVLLGGSLAGSPAAAQKAEGKPPLPRTHGSEPIARPAKSTSATPAPAVAPAPKYRAGEDPDFAARMGWPVKGPAPLAGAILPKRRIVAYYGNPLSKRMGALGEYAPEVMLKKLDQEVARWTRADPSTPAIPALHLIAVVAQGDPGPTGKYRTRMRDSLVEQVSRWADTRKGLVFLDVQVGTGSIQEELPRLLTFLERPNFHLGVDPEFMMKGGHKPGTKIGTMDAADINYVIRTVSDLVKRKNLPPKVLVFHRFTRGMITNYKQIKLDPNVQVVMHMDGWGDPWLKRDSYRDYVVREPVQYTGFKLFYHNDTKKGTPLMSPDDVLKLHPKPLYIQYQ